MIASQKKQNGNWTIVQVSSILLGIVLATLGLKGFLLPNHLIDGGVTGLSMLISAIFNWPLSWVLLMINCPFVLFGLREFGLTFLIKGVLAILMLATFIFWIDVPTVTQDLLLAAIFGGVFLGAGIGMVLRGGGILDGTEVVAIIVKKTMNISVGDSILVFNTLLFMVSAFFLGLEVAMYSILCYLSAAKAVDFIVYGIEEYVGIYIVSEQSAVIKSVLITDMNKAVTILSGKTGYSESPVDVLYCVVTRFEVPKLMKAVRNMDAFAFMTCHKISELTGGHLKRRQVI